VKFRLAAGVAIVLIFAGGIYLMRPPPLEPPREADIMATLVTGFVSSMGDAVVISRPSDCRSGGVMKEAVPAALFDQFLAANSGDKGFDFSHFSDRVHFANDPDASPGSLRAEFGAPVVSISRAGYRNEDALVCVEVFAREERAFFVLLDRDHEGWRATREMTAWRAPRPEALDEAEADEEPLFLPRPSQIDRGAIGD
jgi:hypothetical protein